MDEQQDFDGAYDPCTVMARVAHLPSCVQRDVERITRIVRASFGYGGNEMPERCRILSVALVGPLADSRRAGNAVAGYDFRVVVSFPECVEESYWSLARKIIASEFGARHPVTLAIEPSPAPASDALGKVGSGIALYDALSDVALNARELRLDR